MWRVFNPLGKPSLPSLQEDKGETATYVAEGQKFRVNVNEEEYEIEIISLSDSKATLRVISTKKELSFDIGQKTEIDADGDNKLDTVLTLDGIERGIARIVIAIPFEMMDKKVYFNGQDTGLEMQLNSKGEPYWLTYQHVQVALIINNKIYSIHNENINYIKENEKTIYPLGIAKELTTKIISYKDKTVTNGGGGWNIE